MFNIERKGKERKKASVFSERGLSFTFAICRRPSVCRLQRSWALLRGLKFSAMFLRYLVPWPSVSFR